MFWVELYRFCERKTKKPRWLTALSWLYTRLSKEEWRSSSMRLHISSCVYIWTFLDSFPLHNSFVYFVIKEKEKQIIFLYISRHFIPGIQHTHTHTHTHIYIYIYICQCIHVNMCTYIYIYIYIYVCMYIIIYACIYRRCSARETH